MKEYADLEPGQERAIFALLSEPTLKAAAASASISETTLWRWLREPAFKDAYRKARSDALAQATAKLQALAAEAVDTLVEVHRNREIGAHIRVSAARAILELAYKVHEIEDLEARIEALEEAAV
jgi:hypothetical protein